MQTANFESKDCGEQQKKQLKDYEQLPKFQKLSTQNEGIDNCLGGGFPTFGIHEVYGEAGSGKTQFALQMAFVVQFPQDLGGLAASCLYCTLDQKPPPIKRLRQLEQHFREILQSGKLNEKDLKCLDSPPGDIGLHNIFIEQFQEEIDFRRFCQNRLRVAIEKKNVKLVIIDSIAALYRFQDTSGDFYERYLKLSHIVSLLRAISLEYGIVFIIINQVKSSFLNVNPLNDLHCSEATLAIKNEKSDRVILPALGYLWSSLINSRIRLEIFFGNRNDMQLGNAFQQENSDFLSPFQQTTMRRLKVEYMPSRKPEATASDSCCFKIGCSGLESL